MTSHPVLRVRLSLTHRVFSPPRRDYIYNSRDIDNLGHDLRCLSSPASSTSWPNPTSFLPRYSARATWQQVDKCLAGLVELIVNALKWLSINSFPGNESMFCYSNMWCLLSKVGWTRTGHEIQFCKNCFQCQSWLCPISANVHGMGLSRHFIWNGILEVHPNCTTFCHLWTRHRLRSLVFCGIAADQTQMAPPPTAFLECPCRPPDYWGVRTNHNTVKRIFNKQPAM